MVSYGEEDGFVCKLQPDGSALVFCTYFGTNDFNIVRDIDIDPQGNVYIASSAEADFPASDTYFNGSYQPQRKAGLDCVVAKLNASGSSFAWATWIGGSGDDGTQPSVRVDGQGECVVCWRGSKHRPAGGESKPAVFRRRRRHLPRQSVPGREGSAVLNLISAAPERRGRRLTTSR